MESLQLNDPGGSLRSTPATLVLVSPELGEEPKRMRKTRMVWTMLASEFMNKDFRVPPGTVIFKAADLGRAAKENSPVAKLAKSFGGQPKVLATSATVGMKSSAARLIIVES